MTNISQLVFLSSLSGLGNTSTIEQSEAYSSESIGAFGVSSSTILVPMETTDSLYRLQVQLSGLDDTWYPITTQFNWYNNTTVGSATQLIVIYPSSDGNNLELSVNRFNQTGGTISLSAFTLNIKVREMRSPF